VQLHDRRDRQTDRRTDGRAETCRHCMLNSRLGQLRVPRLISRAASEPATAVLGTRLLPVSLITVQYMAPSRVHWQRLAGRLVRRHTSTRLYTVDMTDDSRSCSSQSQAHRSLTLPASTSSLMHCLHTYTEIAINSRSRAPRPIFWIKLTELM